MTSSLHEHPGRDQTGTLAFWSRALGQAFHDTFSSNKTDALKGDMSAWQSMLAAASEEVGDDTVFEFQVSLPAGRTYDELAKAILTRGAEAPGLKVIVQEVAAEFQLTEKESLSAIDRALGGMFRAMTGKTEARPSATGDPVAAAAFDLCQREPQSMEALWPGWQEWKREI